MSALTVERVLAWRPEALSSAAGELEPTADGLDQSQHRVRAAGDALGGEWTGPAAAAAQQRISADTRDAAQLAAAVRSAQSALRSGAGALGGARSDLLGVVHDARGRGFSVANDGSVTPPATPPVMYGTQPGAAQAAQAAYDDALTRAQAEAQRLADAVGTALAAAGRADSATATSLQAVQIPQGLRERVDSFVGRLRDSHDMYAALGKAGGLAVGGKALKDAWKLFSKGKAFGQYLSNSLRAAVAAGPAARFLTGSGEVADAAAFLRFQALMGKADTALGVFRIGRAPTWLVGARTVAGKAFLPLTVVSGLGDVVTGGGYTGACGWATRGFGLAGAGGAVAVLAMANPVGIAVGGAAVLAYGAWSLGNFVYDHRQEIGRFASSAASWTGDRLGDAGAAVSQASDWAGSRIADAGRGLGQAASKVSGVLSAGLNAIPLPHLF